jgi:hypothetical protein
MDAFDEVLDATSLDDLGLYSVLEGVRKHKQIAYRRPIRINGVSYDDHTHAVTIGLARPTKGVVQVTVRPGIKAVDGRVSLDDFTAFVR